MIYGYRSGETKVWSEGEETKGSKDIVKDGIVVRGV